MTIKKLAIPILLLSINLSWAQGYKLSFGSCLHQEKPLDLLGNASKTRSDAFVFLGDNVYADTYDSIRLNGCYQELACNSNFQRLIKHTPIYATWDDHDYGANDVGKHYPLKEASKRIFMSFFKIPSNHEMRSHTGIYHSQIIKHKGKSIHLILLDTRTFRSDLTLSASKNVQTDGQVEYDLIYAASDEVDSTMLGTEQWVWLKDRLSKKASLTVIASSTQFGASYNGYETWSNFPLEKIKMLQLIDQISTCPVVFISGDVHYAELSKDTINDRVVYDLTSSGISETWGFAAPNTQRIAGPEMKPNFGLLKIQPWRKRLTFQIWTAEGVAFQKVVLYRELMPSIAP